MAAKEGRQPGYKGVSYQFVVDVPSTLLCNVCLELCSDPQQAVCCGKLFCLGCIEKAKARNNDKSCPCCRQPIKTFPDKRTEQEIGNLRIVCSNFGRGCRERPELRNAEKHKNGCPLELIPCQFSDVGCPATMLRKDSKDHNTKEIVEHLDLCRRRIAKLEKIQKPPEKVSCLKSPSDVKGKEIQKGEIVVSRQPNRVAKIEVAYHDRMMTSTYRMGFDWLSDPFRLDNLKFRLRINFSSSRDISYTVYLQLAEQLSRQVVNGAGVKLLGDCELLLKETGKILNKFRPFQITFKLTCKRGDDEYEDSIGSMRKYDDCFQELKVSPCVVYKLYIWKLTYCDKI